MRTSKNIILIFCSLIFFVLGTLIYSKESSANGETNLNNPLKIVVEKNATIKLTGAKVVKVKVYFNGKNVTKDANIKFKNSNKKVFKISPEENFDYEVIGFYAYPKKKGNVK